MRLRLHGWLLLAALLPLFIGCKQDVPAEKNYIETGEKVCMFYGGFDRVISFKYQAQSTHNTSWISDVYTVRCKDGSTITREIWK